MKVSRLGSRSAGAGRRAVSFATYTRILRPPLRGPVAVAEPMPGPGRIGSRSGCWIRRPRSQSEKRRDQEKAPTGSAGVGQPQMFLEVIRDRIGYDLRPKDALSSSNSCPLREARGDRVRCLHCLRSCRSAPQFSPGIPDRARSFHIPDLKDIFERIEFEAEAPRSEARRRRRVHRQFGPPPSLGLPWGAAGDQARQRASASSARRRRSSAACGVENRARSR